MRNMRGLEGAFLHLETPATPMHVAALFLLEAPTERNSDFAGEIRRQLLPRLALSPLMRARLAPMPLQFANPVWIDGGAPDFAYHLRQLSRGAGGRPVNRSTIETLRWATNAAHPRFQSKLAPPRAIEREVWPQRYPIRVAPTKSGYDFEFGRSSDDHRDAKSHELQALPLHHPLVYELQ